MVRRNAHRSGRRSLRGVEELPVIDVAPLVTGVGDVGETAAATVNAARAEGRRVLCCGTTALRTLETAALDIADPRAPIPPFRGLTDLYILPGFPFRAADLLLTNFHLPRSTLLMLVSAFAGTRRMRAAYAYAIAQRYRFFSFGDASLLSRMPQDLAA